MYFCYDYASFIVTELTLTYGVSQMLLAWPIKRNIGTVLDTASSSQTFPYLLVLNFHGYHSHPRRNWAVDCSAWWPVVTYCFN